MPKLTENQYGFSWGPVTVERHISDEKKGWVVLGIKSNKHKEELQIYVTKTGFIRVCRYNDPDRGRLVPEKNRRGLAR